MNNTFKIPTIAALICSVLIIGSEAHSAWPGKCNSILYYCLTITVNMVDLFPQVGL
jgi:hypothetical protein